jgi:hypothetical protein
LAFIAAGAAEEWVELDPEQCKATLGKFLVLAPVLWGVVLAGMLYALVVQSISLADAWKSLLHPIAVAVVILGLLGATLLRPSTRVLGYGLSLLAFISLWSGLHHAIPYTPAAQVFPDTSFIRSLQAMDTRVSGSSDLENWPLSAHDISQVFKPGKGLKLQRYQEFMNRMQEDPLLFRRTGGRALLLRKEDVQGNYASLRPVLNIQEVYPSGAVLFRDLEAQQRAYMAYAGRRVEDFDPALLSAELPPLLEGVSLPESDDGNTAAVTIEENGLYNSVQLHIEETRPGVLVLTDALYPGWRVTMDGVEAPLFPVDGLFSGVEVSAGAHTAVFTYRPMSVVVGLIVSLVALAGILLCIRPELFRRQDHDWGGV